jgi:ERCC4-type nuclease
MQIIIDTREQLPYRFQTPAIRGTLATGDYSIAGLDDYIAIERKSLDDLIGCLCTGRQRFERELHRGKALDYFCVIVEATLADIAKGDYRSRMTPKAAIQSLMAFSVRYRLPVFFVESRNYGARVTESLLLKYAREVEQRAEAVSSCAKAA